MDSSQTLQSDAFKRLYPDQFYARFIKDGLRPDGRALGRSRAVTVALGPIDSADASASVKIGHTTALAGVSLEVFIPTDDAPDKGLLQVNVELTPLCSADWRPGRPSESTHVLTETITQILHHSGAVDLTSLCIKSGQAAFLVTIDIYILDSDGSLLDAGLLAAVSALSCLKLPGVLINSEGKVERAQPDAQQVPEPLPMFALRCIPMCITCGVYGGDLIIDPTAEEESLMSTIVSIVMTDAGKLVGVYKPGGAAVSTQVLRNCMQAATLNAKHMLAVLTQELQKTTQQ